jgi:bifunctional non-homologous end joining protein LigD
MGLEGIISKRRSAPYQSGRGRDWVKVKCLQEQEFVIVGYTDPQGSRTAFGALLLAAHGGDGRLVGVGKVGTGFDEALLRGLYARLQPLAVAASPIANPPRGAAARGVHWVRPELVAEIAFTALTDDLNLRHPVFRGLREDKSAAEVGIERPEHAPEADMGTKKPRKSAAPAARKARTTRIATPAAVRTARGKQRFEVAGVSLSNPDKVLYADASVTKLDLARYYEQIGDWILPHIENRPLTLVRCPSGYGDCFYQKHIDDSAPAVIRRVAIPGDAQPYGAVDSLSGVVALVQLGVLELHTWGARRDRVERPDRIVLDLDPDPVVPWRRVIEAARQVREAFALLELESFVKTTGGKGLHVVVPFRRGPAWDEVKAFSRAVAEAVSAASPGRYTLNISKAKRRGKVLIDYLRNGMGATAVEAYSTRARAGAPVAVPLSWDELGPDMREDHFNVRNVPERLRHLKQDPWKDYAAVKQSITAAVRKQVGSL